MIRKITTLGLFLSMLFLPSCMRKKPVYSPPYSIVGMYVPDTIIGGVFIPAHKEYVVVPLDSVVFSRSGIFAISANGFSVPLLVGFKEREGEVNKIDTVFVTDIETVYVDTVSRSVILHFRPYVTELSLSQKAQLRDFLSLFPDTAIVHVRVDAYTDSLPPSDTLLNMHLSRARAENVARYLMQVGGGRIRVDTVVWHGPTEYLETNSSEYHRIRNRRVVVVNVRKF